MKNRAMAQSPPSAVGRRASGARYGCGWTAHARPHFQLAFHDHAVAGLEALLDDPGVADAVAGRRPAALRTLLSGAHGVDGLHALHLLHRFLRHQDGVLALVHLHADAAELAGQQGVLRIGEAGLQLQRAGLRVHLVERILDVAGRGEFGVVGQDQRERQARRRAVRPSLVHEQIFRFGHLEADPDGIERNDGGERLRRSWA